MSEFNSFFRLYNILSYVCVPDFFIHLSIGMCRVCLLAVVRKVAVNTDVQIPVLGTPPSLLRFFKLASQSEEEAEGKRKARLKVMHMEAPVDEKSETPPHT